ncbi:hypothetical protein MED121_15844 [Marinomonas sp. MED121]|nr:hypothetical protein MED121_15844 [Marinomonas sp. MED121]
MMERRMGQSNKLGFLEIEAKEVESDRHQVGLSQFVNSNKVFCFSLFLFLCFLISTLVSVAVSLIVVPTPTPSTHAIMQLSNSINEIKIEQTQLLNNFHTFKAEHTSFEQRLSHSSASVLKNILMEQELNFQSFLHTLKAGMLDLSTELPNGADWYENYGHQITQAQQHSIKRHSLLNMVKTDDAAMVGSDSP